MSEQLRASQLQLLALQKAGYANGLGLLSTSSDIGPTTQYGPWAATSVTPEDYERHRREGTIARLMAENRDLREQNEKLLHANRDLVRQLGLAPSVVFTNSNATLPADDPFMRIGSDDKPLATIEEGRKSSWAEIVSALVGLVGLAWSLYWVLK